MEERGKCQPERKECCTCWSKRNLFPFSHLLSTLEQIQDANRADIRLRHRESGREGVRERERERDEECCNEVRECKTERSCDPCRPVISLRTKDWSAVF